MVEQNKKYKTGDFAGFGFCILTRHVRCGVTKYKYLIRFLSCNYQEAGNNEASKRYYLQSIISILQYLSQIVL